MSADRDEWDYGPFKVGDVVEGHGFINSPCRNGMKAIIVLPLDVKISVLRHSGNIVNEPVYGIDWEDGAKGAARPSNLRRRKPPMTGLEDVLAMFKVQPNRMKEVVQ